MNFAHAEVATLDPTTMRTLCEEYIANNYIDPETSERLGVKRGLRNPDGTGVLAGLTNVCDVVGYKKDQEGHVIPTPGKLIYRGVNINEIVDEAYRNDRFVFEEVIWLLLFGSLPTREQLDDFCEILAESRALPDGFMDTMNAPSPNIMNKLQRCVLGLYSYDDRAEDLSLENILNQSINLIASMPTMMVNAYQMKRRYYDKQSMFFHLPKPGQSTAEHILSTYRPDQKFTHEEAKLLDMCLLVHRRPRRRQLLHLYHPCAVLLRYGHLLGHLCGHRCSEGPQARRREPDGQPPAAGYPQARREPGG